MPRTEPFSLSARQTAWTTSWIYAKEACADVTAEHWIEAQRTPSLYLRSETWSRKRSAQTNSATRCRFPRQQQNRFPPAVPAQPHTRR